MANKPTIIVSGGCEKTRKELADRIEVSLQAIGLTCVVESDSQKASEGPDLDEPLVRVRSRQLVYVRNSRAICDAFGGPNLALTLVGATKKIIAALHGEAPRTAKKVYLPSTRTAPDELIDETGTIAIGRVLGRNCNS